MNTNLTRIIVPAALLIGVASAAFAQAAPDIAEAGRKVVAAAGPAVVTFQMVIKATISQKGGESNQNESKSEATGVIIDPSGLAVGSLTTFDPSAFVGQMMDDESMSFRFEVTDLKYLMPDGSEVPGKIVLRDKDQDLVFIRPVTKPETPMAFVDMKNNATLDLLDNVVLVGRAGKVMNRALAARLDRVKALIEKPRRRYMLDAAQVGSQTGDIGCPGFTPDGRVVGVELIRFMKGSGDADSRSSDIRNNTVAVLVPASDILVIAAQAPEDAPKEVAPPASAVKPAAKPAPKPAPAPKKAAPAKKK
ncbi:MAG TPA: serine protease [Armatimonadota bacterium]|jgi:S1-C subfamily serine protease